MESKQVPVIITSNVKKVIKASNSLNTSAEVIDVLNERVRTLLAKASEKAVADGRKTVMARDFLNI
jgi:histone H3/H4